MAAVLRRRPAFAFSAALALVLAALFADPLFRPRSFTGRDLVAYFYPVEKAVHDQWGAGHIPLILPELSFGKPLAANPNAGVFYPPRIVMAALPFAVAMKLFIVLHLWLAGVGAFLLARFLGTAPSGAAVAGWTFALGGPVLSEAMFPDFLPGAATIPFVILAGAHFANQPSRRSAALFGAAWGWSLLAGDVFTGGVSLLGAALAVIQQSPQQRRIRTLGGLALGTLPGFLIAGIQTIPALLFLPHTVRALGRFPLRATVTWSVSLWRFLELFVRFPFGNIAKTSPVWGDALWSGKTAGFSVTLYVGALGTLAFFGARPPAGRRLLPYGLACFCAAVAVAGFYIPRAWLDAASPIPLRYPEKLMVGFALSAALLAGMLTDRLRQGRAGRLWLAAAGIAVVLALFAVLSAAAPKATRSLVLAAWTRFPAAANAAAHRFPGILVGASLLWGAAAAVLLTASILSSPRIAALLLIVFAAADLGALRFAFLRTAPDREVLGSPPEADAVRRVNIGQTFGYLPLEDYYRAGFDRRALLLDSAALDGVFDVFNEDYDTADLYRVELARRAIYREAGRWRGLPRFLSAFGARTTLIERGRIPEGFDVPVGVFGPRWLLVNPSAVPLVRLAPSVDEVPGPAQAWAALQDADRDPVGRPVVETESPGARALTSGRVRVIGSTPWRIEVETVTAGPARVILPRAFFPFREATIDGASATCEPANLVLSSVAVPAGTHRVALDEKLPGGVAGPATTAAGMALLALLGLRSRSESRREGESV